jgi:Pyridoxamine 5'-phosphate oxidase
MGKAYPELNERLRKFIGRQSVFFVATAPCLTADGEGGHVNVSPKGYRDTFAILGPLQVAYLDLTGSGAETIAHLRQNGKITIMFCSFEREPKILRLYGTGRIALPGAPEWQELAGRFPATGYTSNQASRRAIIVVDLDRIADSCGYAVPMMELTQERDLLVRSDEKKSAVQLDAYRAEKNAVSIDGLPALGIRNTVGTADLSAADPSAADLSAADLSAAEPARRGSGTGLA